MRIVVLGSAAGGGFPQWNCGCFNCRRARSGDPEARPRTQSSLAVSAVSDRDCGPGWYLLNASPDIRQQIEQTPALHPPEGRLRGSPIAGVILTNADVDHIAGLLSLRERQPISLIATYAVHRILCQNPVFSVLDPSVVSRRTLPLNEPVILEAGGAEALSVTAFPVPGKVALWMEDAAGGDLQAREGDIVGLEIAGGTTGARFFYIPGCAAMTAELADRLQGAALVFFDGTAWSDDEMKTAGVGEKTAARMGHMSMSGPAGSIAAFAGLEVRRKIFIHVNNTNPALIASSPERRFAHENGWEIAEDGQEVML